MIELGTYIRCRDEKKGHKKASGYVIESGHKSMQVQHEVVLQIEDKLLTYYRCTESKILCCYWADVDIFMNQWCKL